MAYNEILANHLRIHLKQFKNSIEEKKMFGGISFLYHGKMSIGIIKNDLAVRVIKSKIENELKKDNVSPMEFTKRPMKEYILVKVRPEEDLSYWINLGIEHARQ